MSRRKEATLSRPRLYEVASFQRSNAFTTKDRVTSQENTVLSELQRDAEGLVW